MKRRACSATSDVKLGAAWIRSKIESPQRLPATRGPARRRQTRVRRRSL